MMNQVDPFLGGPFLERSDVLDVGWSPGCHSCIDLQLEIDESILEEISSRNRNKSLTLSNFLKLDLEAGDEEEEQEINSENYDSFYCKKTFDKNDKDSDEIMTGYMQKKSYLTLLLISF